MLTMMLRFFCAACCALQMSVVWADALLGDQIETLLARERAALAGLSDSRVQRLTSLPSGLETLEPSETQRLYDRDYIETLPAATGGPQWECLTQALYFEARGESIRGMFAVGEVILNRVDSRRYPDTLCRVINQGTGRKFACQFSYTCDGLLELVNDQRSWQRMGKVARLLMDGAPRDLTGGATHYHTRAVNPFWAREFPQTAAIGAHLFYREPLRTASG